MKTATIRQLKHATRTVLSWVAEGETVEVRNRRQPVALLSPLRRGRPAARPDFLGRVRDLYGTRVLSTTGTDVVAEARGSS
jgi:antitoxin (DNA-binding transcriptional repressor) of toxin-antitoxin stability system